MATGWFRLGRWTVDPDRNRLADGATVVRVEHTVMQLLVWLAANGDRDLTRAEILAGVWGPGVHSDEVLNVAMSALRRALGDSPRSPQYVKTLPRLGYRLIAQPRQLARQAEWSPDVQTGREWPRPVVAAVVLVGLVLTIALTQVLVEVLTLLRSS